MCVTHYSYYKNRVCVNGHQNKNLTLTPSNMYSFADFFIWWKKSREGPYLSPWKSFRSFLASAHIKYSFGSPRPLPSHARNLVPSVRRKRARWSELSKTSQLPMMDCKFWIYIWEVRVFQCVTIVIRDIGLYGYLQGHKHTCCNLLWTVELSLPVLMTCVCHSRYLKTQSSACEANALTDFASATVTSKENFLSNGNRNSNKVKYKLLQYMWMLQM